MFECAGLGDGEQVRRPTPISLPEHIDELGGCPYVVPPLNTLTVGIPGRSEAALRSAHVTQEELRRLTHNAQR